jgi:hypothetical protein
MHALAAAIALGAATQAQAVDFTIGEIEGQLDSSLSVGASWATRGAEPHLVGTRNGGKASSRTSDDGRMNFKKGETFSKIFKGIHDLELKYGDSGVFVRGKYWYDFELKDESRLLYDIDDHNRKEAAQSSGAQILDAFVYHNYDIAEQPGSVRLGKQVVSWGESTFILNSINAINPVDVAAFRRPGAEIKEGLIPVNMFYLSQSLTDSLSAEAFYQLEWDQTVIDNCGTFFAPADVVADGCERLVVDGSDYDTSDIAGGYAYLARRGDYDARDSGQWGVALRYIAEELNQTEFGFYAMNYHSRTPIVSYITNSVPYLPGTGALGANGVDSTGALTGGYRMEYPEDIRLYGLSFATNVGPTAVNGEISYRPNMPMQINTTDLTLAAIAPIGLAYANDPVYTSGHASFPAVAGSDIKGYERKPFTQAQLTLTQFFDQVAGAERLTLVGEAGYSHIGNLGENELRFGRSPEYGTGVFPSAGLCEGLNPNPEKCDSNGFYTTTSWGYRARAILDYNDVFAGINLKPNVSWSHDVDGYGPTFNEGNKAVSLGLDAEYQNTYTASLSYTDFFGGDYNTNIDRDFVALSVGVNF